VLVAVLITDTVLTVRFIVAREIHLA